MSDTSTPPAATQLAVIPPQSTALATPFASVDSFAAAQRMCKALTSSTLVPENYRGDLNMGNALVALEMAQRVGASVMSVMQNLHVIQGRPSWSATFIIAALNSCGRFSPLRFEVTKGPGKTVGNTQLAEMASCTAWAYDRATGERLEGPAVTYEMAIREGWWNKNGSKWQTMPELMLRYRAAAFFGRLYAPDVLNGMHTVDEVQDSAIEADVLPAKPAPKASSLNDDLGLSAPKVEVAPPPAAHAKPKTPRTPKAAPPSPPVVEAETEEPAEQQPSEGDQAADEDGW